MSAAPVDGLACKSAEMGLLGQAGWGEESTRVERGFHRAAGWDLEGQVLSLALPHSAGGPGLTSIPDVPQFPSLETAQLSALLQLD